MQITKERLKQLIKEELDASEQEEQINEMIDIAGISGIDPNTLGNVPLVALAAAQIAANLAPAAILGGLAAYFMQNTGDPSTAREDAKEIYDAAQKNVERAKQDAKEISSDLGPKR